MGRKKVLITGAAGRIGQVVRAGLKQRYDLHLLYRRTVLPAAEGEKVFIGDINDAEVLEEAVEGTDAIVHMAGDPRVEAPWEAVLEANIKGVYCL